jgi:hypothetical protein
MLLFLVRKRVNREVNTQQKILLSCLVLYEERLSFLTRRQTNNEFLLSESIFCQISIRGTFVSLLNLCSFCLHYLEGIKATFAAVLSMFIALFFLQTTNCSPHDILVLSVYRSQTFRAGSITIFIHIFIYRNRLDLWARDVPST